MSKVTMNTIINASADEVWKLLRDFNGLPRFIAAIKASTMEGAGVGAVRTLIVDGGGPPIVERLERLDDKARTLSYSIVTSPLPVEGYFATVEVKDAGAGRCELTWSSTFQPKDAPESVAVQTIEGVYAGAFEGLKTLFKE